MREGDIKIGKTYVDRRGVRRTVTAIIEQRALFPDKGVYFRVHYDLGDAMEGGSLTLRDFALLSTGEVKF